MIEEAKILLKIIKKYFILIFIIPICLSLISYYFFRVIEKNSYTIYNYDYLIDIQEFDLSSIQQNLSMLSNTFNYLDIPFSFGAKFSNQIDYDKHVQSFYLKFYDKLKESLKEVKKETQIYNVHTNGYEHDQIIKINFFNNYHNENKTFHLSFKTGYNDENYYKLFFLDILKDANDAYSKSINTEINYLVNNIFDNMLKLKYVIDSHLDSLQFQIDTIDKDILDIKAASSESENLYFSNLEVSQLMSLQGPIKKRKEELILLNNILNTAELEIKNYLLEINNTKVGYTKDANNNLRINQFEDVNYIFHYIHYFIYVFFVILILFLTVIYEYIAKRKS